jgi:hypothetical protein
MLKMIGQCSLVNKFVKEMKLHLANATKVMLC